MTLQNSEYYQKIINLINESEFKKAKIILEDNKNKFLNDCLFFTTLAYINDQLEEYNDSESNYKKALDLDSNFYDAKFNLAVLYCKLRDYLKSENLFKELIKLNSKDYLSFYNLGLILFEKKDYKNSIIFFNNVCALNSKFWPAYHHLAQAYEEIEQYNLSIINYENAIKFGNSNAGISYNNLGNVYLKLKKYNLSYINFLKSLKYKLDKSLVYNNLAILLLEKASVEKAILYFKKAVNSNPKNSKIQSRLIATSLYSPKHKNFYAKYISDYEKFLNNFKNITKTFSYNKDLYKIKVGFLSSDFKEHPVSYFLFDHL